MGVFLESQKDARDTKVAGTPQIDQKPFRRTLHRQESQRKADLEIAIDDYLSVNPTAHPKVKGYFSSRGRKASSPVKREPPAPLADDPPAAKPSRRRTIKPVEDAVPE